MLEILSIREYLFRYNYKLKINIFSNKEGKQMSSEDPGESNTVKVLSTNIPYPQMKESNNLLKNSGEEKTITFNSNGNNGIVKPRLEQKSELNKELPPKPVAKAQTVNTPMNEKTTKKDTFNHMNQDQYSIKKTTEENMNVARNLTADFVLSHRQSNIYGADSRCSSIRQSMDNSEQQSSQMNNHYQEWNQMKTEEDFITEICYLLEVTHNNIQYSITYDLHNFQESIVPKEHKWFEQKEGETKYFLEPIYQALQEYVNINKSLKTYNNTNSFLRNKEPPTKYEIPIQKEGKKEETPLEVIKEKQSKEDTHLLNSNSIPKNDISDYIQSKRDINTITSSEKERNNNNQSTKNDQQNSPKYAEMKSDNKSVNTEKQKLLQHNKADSENKNVIKKEHLSGEKTSQLDPTNNQFNNFEAKEYINYTPIKTNKTDFAKEQSENLREELILSKRQRYIKNYPFLQHKNLPLNNKTLMAYKVLRDITINNSITGIGKDLSDFLIKIRGENTLLTRRILQIGEIFQFMQTEIWHQWKTEFEKALNNFSFYNTKNRISLNENFNQFKEEIDEETIMEKDCNQIRTLQSDFIEINILGKQLNEQEISRIHEICKDITFLEYNDRKLSTLGYTFDDKHYVRSTIRRLTETDNLERFQKVKSNPSVSNLVILKIEISQKRSKEFTDCTEQAIKMTILSIIKRMINERSIFVINNPERDIAKSKCNIAYTKMEFITKSH